MTGSLFYNDEYEALALMISHSGKTFKEVACFLFPERKAESAYARLKACLNPEKDERLTFGQIIVAMKFCGQFDPLYFACDETLHDRPQQRAPEDQEAELARIVEKAADTMQQAMRQLQALQDRRVVRIRK
jgi:hypothetical protein